ncbi:hypothetical protein BT69DRAFT_1335777 [Atractiella rhizophila]|nr:hypothetical protein BT69DRAFT_1335777 [Atractiella rhizophila]
MALTAEEFIGGWLLGGCLASVMFGLLLFQSAYYFLHYRSDYLPYKILVSLLTLICSVSWSVIIALMWHYLVASRDSPIAELKHNPGIQFVVFCAPWPAGLLSQLFFAMRCYWVSDRNKTYLAIFIFLIFASAAAYVSFFLSISSLPFMHQLIGLAAIIVDGLATASFTGGGRTPAIVKSVGSLIQAWLWINAATDLVISTCLALQLNKGRKYRGQTFLALSFAWATVDAIVVQLTAGHSNYQLVLFLPLPFIYSLCAIATLNFRDTLRTIAFSADSPADPTNGGGGHTSHGGGTSGGGGQSRSMISMRTGTGREGRKSRDEEEMVEEESEVHVELKITKEASAEQIVLDQLSGKSFNSKRG